MPAEELVAAVAALQRIVADILALSRSAFAVPVTDLPKMFRTLIANDILVEVPILRRFRTGPHDPDRDVMKALSFLRSPARTSVSLFSVLPIDSRPSDRPGRPGLLRPWGVLGDEACIRNPRLKDKTNSLPKMKRSHGGKFSNGVVAQNEIRRFCTPAVDAAFTVMLVLRTEELPSLIDGEVSVDMIVPGASVGRSVGSKTRCWIAVWTAAALPWMR